jgi:hypothetical protein
MKAKDGLNVTQAATRLKSELRVAKDTLTSEKMRRDTFQICILWRLLQEPTDPDTEANLAKLTDLTQSVAKRCREGDLDNTFQWCDSILTAAEGLHFGVNRSASMHLLGQAALNLNQIVYPEFAKSDHLRAIEEAVARIKARKAATAEPEESQVVTVAAG